MDINGKQSVKLEKGVTKFENYFKETPVPFKIYAYFGCNLQDVECYEASYTKKYLYKNIYNKKSINIAEK